MLFIPLFAPPVDEVNAELIAVDDDNDNDADVVVGVVVDEVVGSERVRLIGVPEGRLLMCRWAAARALFLEVLEAYQPSPSNWHAIGHPWDAMEERGLVGRLCQRHGWLTMRPGVLVRKEAPRRG